MKFLIPEFSNKMLEIMVPQKLQYDVYDTFEEAARVFYWGMSGWDYVWPLYFELYTDNHVFVSKADIYILSSDANLILDIIIKDGIGS
jgi:hypothetical protein